ncbi:MAG TPA: hypothetical protein P5243_09130 [Bacteroidales bacterium]|nr:hypothetical protein [Bacteroidales bacterium]
MAYNKKNKYRKIIEIQNIVNEYKAKGVTQEFIYKNYIKDVYFISRDCFYSYLATNAKRELKKLEEIDNMQKSLF